MTRPEDQGQADRPSPPGAPRWVKVAAIVFAVLIVLLVVSKLAGVDHGPGRHMPPAGVSEHGPPQP